MIFIYLFILFFIFQLYILKNRNIENFFYDECQSIDVPSSVIYGDKLNDCITNCNDHMKIIKGDTSCNFENKQIRESVIPNLQNKVYEDISTNLLKNITNNDEYTHIFSSENNIYPDVGGSKTRCLNECLSCKSPTRCKWKHIFEEGDEMRMSGGLLPSENQTTTEPLSKKEIILKYSAGNNMLYWTIHKNLIDNYNGGCVNNNMYNISFKLDIEITKILSESSETNPKKEKLYRLCDLNRVEDPDDSNLYRFQISPDFFEKDIDACYNITLEYINDQFLNIKTKPAKICKKKEDIQLPGVMSSTDLLGNLLNKTLEISL